MIGPVAGGQLVLDQPVGGRRIRHAQQCFGQHHQGKALLGGERVFAQEILDAAEPAAGRADRLDQPRRARIDAAFGGWPARSLRQQARRDLLVGRSIRRGEVGQGQGMVLFGDITTIYATFLMFTWVFRIFLDIITINDRHDRRYHHAARPDRPPFT
jgi:hypothetical protein